jgi:hypothetical protein
MVHMWKEELWEGEEFEISRLENEGGKPKMDADWEPSASEVFTINATAKLSSTQLQYRFTCLVEQGIRHVTRYYYNRLQATFNPTTLAPEPSVAQQVGEFVTELRRLLRADYSDLYDAGFRELTNTDLWINVAVPNPRNDYRWRFGLLTSDGLYQMSIAIAQTLCENAHKMATSDKTSDEEFREINNSLNNLLREQTALDSLIYRAKDLNAQASSVVDNLYQIAEKLQECD